MASRRIVPLFVAAIALLVGAWFAVERATRSVLASLAPFAASEDESASLRAPRAVDLAANTAPSERALPPKSGVRGRLIDAVTGAPIAHWKVSMITPGNVRNVQVAQAAEFAGILRDRLKLPPGAVTEYTLEGSKFELGLTDQLATVRGEGAKIGPGDYTVHIVLPNIAISQQPDSSAAVDPPPAQDANEAGAKPTDLVNGGDDAGAAQAAIAQLAHGTAASNAAAEGQASEEAQAGVEPAVARLARFQLRADQAPPIVLKYVFKSAEIPTGGAEQESASVFRNLVLNAMDQRSAQGHFVHAFRAADVGRHLRRGGVGDNVVETTTDDDGRFEFACPEGDESFLVLDTPDHLDATPRSWPLGPTASACLHEITWKVTFERIGILRGRVLDADTNEPVPGLGVGLRAKGLGLDHGDARWDMVTDERGEFATPYTLNAGHIELLFADGSEHEFQVGRDEIEFTAPADEAQRAEFRVHPGPTFRFLPRLTSDEIQGDLALRFVNLVPANLPPGTDNPLAQWRADDLHKEECVWFRGPASVRREHAGPIYAEWTAADGLVFGRVEIESIAPVDPNALPVAFSISASVHGTVRVPARAAGASPNDENGVEVEGAHVRVLDASGAVLGEWTTDEMGQYLIPGLQGSRAATIEARHPKHGSASTSVALRNGEPAQVDLTLK